MELQPNQRKCVKCGVIIEYSTLDAKTGKIPDQPLCPKCATRGLVTKIGKVKDDDEKDFRGSGVEGTKVHKSKSWKSRPDQVPEVQ